VSQALVDALAASSAALVAALDAQDVDAIEKTLPDLTARVAEMKARGAWAPSPRLKQSLLAALQIVDGARFRLRYLADRNQQHIDMLAEAAGRFDCTPATYSRNPR
jgi:hypothetical protein